jgi:hypothetical protein
MDRRAGRENTAIIPKTHLAAHDLAFHQATEKEPRGLLPAKAFDPSETRKGTHDKRILNGASRY